MSRQPSWEAIAHVLAGRLLYQVGLCYHANDDPGCPGCQDTAAFRAYQTKCKSLGFASVGIPTPDGPLVRIEDIPLDAIDVTDG